MTWQDWRAPTLALLLATTAPNLATAKPPARPWMNTSLSADQRAALVVGKMTQAEKLGLVIGAFGRTQPGQYTPPRAARANSAGYVPGIPRLGIPPLWETDAGMGVATQRTSGKVRERTSLPSGLATAATWNPELAYRGGAMIGAEARDSGFNVLLAGGVNLMREPRNGRNFEYAGEDPLLAGVMVGAQIRGAQSNHIVATAKHFAVNDQENGRNFLSSEIGDAEARTSDLMAFQIAVEQGDPGSVMCAYNRVNTAYACENDYLLNQVLKRDWGFKGWVMSDWGAVHSTVQAANGGLDQESAASFDASPFFGVALKQAVADGKVSQARLDDMARRIVRGLFAKGVIDHPVAIRPIDFAAHAAVTQADAEEAMVLLKNDGALLPLSATARRIAVIGSHADVGVLSGGGSSQVYAVGGVGGMAVPGLGPNDFPGPLVYHPSSPLKAIRAQAPRADVAYADGTDPQAAAALAAHSDIAVVFVNVWSAESLDSPLGLPDGQDALVAAVAKANSHTVVVLETGGPVLMPWLDQVGAVLEAWYPGTRGGEAIARVLFGEVAPSGRLPISFPRSEDQLPRPRLDGDPKAPNQMFDVQYSEGAAVGYKWFDRQKLEPLFPFGYGLSYTRFAYDGLQARAAGDAVTIGFDVKNLGDRAGKDTPQVYIGPKAGGWEAPRRLVGGQKGDLAPGRAQHVIHTVDPRLLATYDPATRTWRIAPGDYEISLGASSRSLTSHATVSLAARTLPVGPSGK